MMKPRHKKQVVKSSFASAFNSIISKKVEPTITANASTTVISDGPILAKYKKPAKEVSEENKREHELR
jgi:hypothetical protein